ncbi:hypothetical protein F1559_000518 [Cyanidiococcus yangmingshanensis]|uniref:Uncharacterized protein n=1 Tax=Cyanidiococcus yangmingshanensis TaxID=2690220 RepID=A0A7J7IDL1_9RHOD|nr:hypothetical protein F1559_000518 [Cyanidiococcus yangmingshanensis]
MALSCFCAKRTFQNYERTPLPEYEENKKKVNGIESSVGRLIRDLEAVQSNWCRLGDVLSAFASDLKSALPDTATQAVRDTAEKLSKSSEEVGNELRKYQAADKSSPSGKILNYLKEYRKRLADCKAKSAKMENLAKDYDARRSVVEDKERANAPEPKLQRVRDLMYDAEMKFREAEKNVLQYDNADKSSVVGMSTRSKRSLPRWTCGESNHARKRHCFHFLERSTGYTNQDNVKITRVVGVHKLARMLKIRDREPLRVARPRGARVASA